MRSNPFASSRRAVGRNIAFGAALLLFIATGCSSTGTNQSSGPARDGGADRRACQDDALYRVFGVKPTTDGSCSSACLGVCASGRCVEALACAEDTTDAIAVHGNKVFWTNPDPGNLREMPVSGGSPNTLISDPSAFSTLCSGGLAVDSTSVYWTNPCLGTVMKVPLEGGTPVTLASGQNSPGGIAIDRGSVYWTNSGNASARVDPNDGGGANNGSVMKVPLEGGSPTTLASGQHVPLRIAIDGASVYWVSSFGPSVMKVPLGGGTPTVLASGFSWGSGIAVDSAGVYWANRIGNTPSRLPSIMKTPLDGSASNTLAPASAPQAIAIDDESVYWTDIGGSPDFNGTVVKVPLAGGPPTTIFVGHGRAAAVAVDSTSVYWTMSDGSPHSAVIKATPK